MSYTSYIGNKPGTIEVVTVGELTQYNSYSIFNNTEVAVKNVI